MIETIKKIIPNLILTGNIKDKNLNEAIERYDRRVKSLSEVKKEQNTPHCLFDWVLLADTNNKRAKSFISYLENEAIYVLENTPYLFSKKIRFIISNIVLSIDTNININDNPQYLNFIGELIGLNHILKNGNNLFEFKEIELKLSNNKHVDFVFKNKETEELLCVEFLSIHNIDVLKLEVNDDLVLFLEKRFNDKLESKTKDLNENFNKIIIDGNEYNFVILPIIWSETKTLLPFKNAFIKINEKYANVLQCCSLLPQDLGNEEIIYNFCSVLSILEILDYNNIN